MYALYVISWPWPDILTHFPKASKAGLCIYRPGMKVEEEQSQGWISWAWNWGAEDPEQPKEVDTGGTQITTFFIIMLLF